MYQDHFHIQWKLEDRTSDTEMRLCRSLDLLLRRDDQRIPKPDLPTIRDEAKAGVYLSAEGVATNSTPRFQALEGATIVSNFLLSCIERGNSVHDDKEGPTAIKLLLPDADGYTARSDFLERRFDGCDLIDKIGGFLSPRQAVKSAFSDKAEGNKILSLIPAAVGGLRVKVPQDADLKETLTKLDAELNNRISFPWILSDQIPHKRLAWVEGRKDAELSRRMYEAAWALGISLVMIDNPGHWLEDDKGPYAHFREAFIPVRITPDEGFVERIVNAVRGYDKPIDGIMTVSDSRVIGVAKACEKLGLPTSPSRSYALAADKYTTRMMEPDRFDAFQVNSVAQLRQRLASRDHAPLPYPLIVKPSMGWGSECVAKVSKEADLIAATERASGRHATAPQRKTEVVIEPYIDGPEVDVNLVLLNKEIIFFEICDDFPSTGDFSSETSPGDFLETEIAFPSCLPDNELAVLRDSIHQSILRQGFITGVFHCEARVRDSSRHFTVEDGVLELRSKPADALPSREPGCFLLEINARPPGYMASTSVVLTYGVDYFVQQMLFSIADEVRFRALVKPFVNGPQYDLLLQFIPQDRAGMMKSEDPGLELYARCPELMANVREHKTWVKKGDIVLGPMANEAAWLAYFLVVSKKGREEVLRLGREIKREFRYELE